MGVLLAIKKSNDIHSVHFFLSGRELLLKKAFSTKKKDTQSQYAKLDHILLNAFFFRNWLLSQEKEEG